MADVARLAGVSTATVSRAMKHPAVVGTATRQRIEEAIRQINYVPDGLARGLRTRRSHTVILVVRDIGNPFYLEVFRGVEAAAHAHGLSLLMGNTQDDPARERRYFDMIRERRADGMILMTGQLPPEYAGDPTLPLPPLVVALEYLPGRDLPTVQIDNVTASEQATAYLIGLGHRRIAHLTGPLPEVLSVDRLAGFRRALAVAGRSADPALIVAGTYSVSSGRRAALELFARVPRPTAIVCANDEMAMGVIAVAHEQGIRIPAQLSVVGFDDIVFAENIWPALTTVQQPRHEIGETALGLLVQRLAGASLPARPIVLPTRLVIRASSGPVPA